jgi:hypothetical protein
MGAFCCRSGAFAALSRAAAKSAASRLRRLGVLPEAVNWSQRAAVCEACPLRTIHGGVSYCGRPLLRQIDRDVAVNGCGCPTRAKAKAPDEHCPLDPCNRAAGRTGGACTCKWCHACRSTTAVSSVSGR